MAAYLQVVSYSQELSGEETVEELLEIAVKAEKDSIVFYVGLKDFVPSRVGKDNVQNIIKEEMQHLVTLNNALTNLE